jgi:hypothetical protein
MSALTSLSMTAIPPEDEALRAPVRAFLSEALAGVPAHVRAKSWSGYDSAFSRELGRRGWLGITLPREYGGGGRSAFARYVLVEEFLNFGAPVGSHWIADRQSGPLILKYGTEAQKRFYLPPICRGESFFCIGMSEPDAGSDLASVRTRAVKTAPRLHAQRPEDLDHQRPPLPVHDRAGAHLGRGAGPAQGPVAGHRRPEPAGRDRAAHCRPVGRLAFLRSLLRQRGARGRCAHRRGGQGMGAGDGRAGLRAQRPRAVVLQHRAVRRMAGLRAHAGRPHGRVGAAGRQDREPARAVARHVPGRYRQGGAGRQPHRGGRARQGPGHRRRAAHSRRHCRRPVRPRRAGHSARTAAHPRLRDAGGAIVLAARRHARHPAE